MEQEEIVSYIRTVSNFCREILSCHEKDPVRDACTSCETSRWPCDAARLARLVLGEDS